MNRRLNFQHEAFDSCWVIVKIISKCPRSTPGALAFRLHPEVAQVCRRTFNRIEPMALRQIRGNSVLWLETGFRHPTLYPSQAGGIWITNKVFIIKIFRFLNYHSATSTSIGDCDLDRLVSPCHDAGIKRRQSDVGFCFNNPLFREKAQLIGGHQPDFPAINFLKASFALTRIYNFAVRMESFTNQLRVLAARYQICFLFLLGKCLANKSANY
jgi:hypothetical protein